MYMYVPLQVLCRAVVATGVLTAQQVVKNEHGEEVSRHLTFIIFVSIDFYGWLVHDDIRYLMPGKQQLPSFWHTCHLCESFLYISTWNWFRNPTMFVAWTHTVYHMHQKIIYTWTEWCCVALKLSSSWKTCGTTCAFCVKSCWFSSRLISLGMPNVHTNYVTEANSHGEFLEK